MFFRTRLIFLPKNRLMVLLVIRLAFQSRSSLIVLFVTRLVLFRTRLIIFFQTYVHGSACDINLPLRCRYQVHGSLRRTKLMFFRTRLIFLPKNGFMAVFVIRLMLYRTRLIFLSVSNFMFVFRTTSIFMPQNRFMVLVQS